MLVLWIGSINKSAFDPSSKLAIAIMDLEFEKSLINAIDSHVKGRAEPSTVEAASGRIFHFTQGNCYCEWLAKSHKNNLNQWSEKNGFSSVNIDLNLHSELLHLIPSTPAVLALDDNGELLYFGPYSQGSGCFSSRGTIDKRLEAWKDRQVYGDSDASTGSLGAMIDTDASGCYCQT
ncbi:DUF6436 domain-containing protein [Glaciecola petra]|uniref:DUF6436 domain-containing protein n=1 Tax=Glaciecola petra TaxID=3075602 RepID=A0ABU2ZSA6_9ALTE|nr:DUF6436 domain-containing protein [Aestuariibacter sp. P117]MDT0595516.1 DUF6436 domain-containing protein [Aestuariibacter sp. P117]